MKTKNSKFDDVAKNACKNQRALASTLKNEKLEAFEKLQKEIKNNQIEVENEQEEAFEVISGSTLLSDDIKAIPMLIPPLFHRIGLALLIGSSDIGKSTLLRQLCISVVTGKPFLGMDVQPIFNRALYVSSEDDQMSISYLLKRQNNEFKLKPEELEGLK